MRADETRAGLWEHAHRTTLAHHRLLLDIEAYALHVRQYDFGWQQPTANVLGRRLGLDFHGPVHCQRAGSRADEAANVTPHPQPAAQVASDRAPAGSPPPTHLHARQGL